MTLEEVLRNGEKEETNRCREEIRLGNSVGVRGENNVFSFYPLDPLCFIRLIALANEFSL
jgi:hypothetical protein